MALPDVLRGWRCPDGALLGAGSAWLLLLRRGRELMLGGLAVAAASAVVAVALARTYDFVYAGQLVGIALMFCGFTLSASAPRPRTAVVAAGAEPRPAPS